MSRVAFLGLALLLGLWAESAFAQAPQQPPASGNPPATQQPRRTQQPARQRQPPQLPAGQYASEAEAQRQCPLDVVVWLNTPLKTYSFRGSALYGKSRRGSYMCRTAANRAGLQPAKNEVAPVLPPPRQDPSQ